MRDQNQAHIVAGNAGNTQQPNITKSGAVPESQTQENVSENTPKRKSSVQGEEIGAADEGVAQVAHEQGIAAFHGPED